MLLRLDNIAYVNLKILHYAWILLENQRLIVTGKQIKDKRTLSYYNINKFIMVLFPIIKFNLRNDDLNSNANKTISNNHIDISKCDFEQKLNELIERPQSVLL